MKATEEVKRIFNIPDAEVLKESMLKLDSFQEYKHLFVERFPELNDPFAAQWDKSVAEAWQQLPDYALSASKSKATNELEKSMETGRNHYQMVLLYTRLAYPKNKRMLHLLGQADYSRSRASHLKLPALLRTACQEASKPEVKQALLEKGLKEPDLGLLEILADEILNRYTAQQGAIKKRSLGTFQRISLLNSIWEQMALVCRCAKLVFEHDFAKYRLFLLPVPDKPEAGEAPPPDDKQ